MRILNTNNRVFEQTRYRRYVDYKLVCVNILRASLVAQMVKNLPAMWVTRALLLDQEDPRDNVMYMLPRYSLNLSHSLLPLLCP